MGDGHKPIKGKARKRAKQGKARGEGEAGYVELSETPPQPSPNRFLDPKGPRKQPKVQQAIRISTPFIVKIIKEKGSGTINKAINGIDKIVKQPMLVQAIKSSVPVILDILESEALNTADAISNILNEMFNHQEIIHLIATAMPTIKSGLRHEEPRIRTFALLFLAGISSKSDQFIHEIQRAILIVLNMRNDENDNTREIVTELLKKLSKQPEFDQFFKEWDHESVKETLALGL